MLRAGRPRGQEPGLGLHPAASAHVRRTRPEGQHGYTPQLARTPGLGPRQSQAEEGATASRTETQILNSNCHQNADTFLYQQSTLGFMSSQCKARADPEGTETGIKRESHDRETSTGAMYRVTILHDRWYTGTCHVNIHNRQVQGLYCVVIYKKTGAGTCTMSSYMIKTCT